MWAISWLAEDLLTSHERLCTMNEVNYYLRFVYLYLAFHSCSFPQLFPSCLSSSTWLYGASSRKLCLRGRLYGCHGNYVLKREAPLGCSRWCTCHEVAIPVAYFALRNTRSRITYVFLSSTQRPALTPLAFPVGPLTWLIRRWVKWKP
jgi:hypothetical protein